ncbi:MAG: putative Peptidylprolyl isomerase [Candidatus Saccharibacteria bacterium]|nr:putative Peptidylprolyl isomerase [Candidatus Saccharibacteria bacterium]
MATSRAQQIGIWIIAIVLTVGTIGLSIVSVLSTNNTKNDAARKTELTNQYQAEYAEYQKKVDAQATELSGKYFTDFSQYSSRAAAFDAAGVTELKTEDLVVGDGADITASSTFTAYYIGWRPDALVFDQSIDGDKLKAPFTAAPGGVISGWSEGVVGMKVGGVRELTIPSAKAYGETGSGDKIPANTPLKFVIMIIPTPPTIAAPQPSAELLKLYSQ